MNKRLFIAAALLLPACSYIESVGQWFNDSPIVAGVVVRQATARFIEADDVPAQRAARVIEVTGIARAYIADDSTATVQSLIAVIDGAIDWEDLGPADRLLLQDLIAVVQEQLISEQDAGRVEPDALIGIQSMLGNIESAAALYL